MKTALISLLNFYRKYLSPMKIQCCRFYPSCSEYAIGALKKHNIFVSTGKICWRILRCNPFSKGGYDPV